MKSIDEERRFRVAREGAGLDLIEVNYPGGGIWNSPELFLYMVPCESEYREGYLKASISGEAGKIAYVFTLHGGTAFDGGQ